MPIRTRLGLKDDILDDGWSSDSVALIKFFIVSLMPSVFCKVLNMRECFPIIEPNAVKDRHFSIPEPDPQSLHPAE